jgi:hypothetical protein
MKIVLFGQGLYNWRCGWMTVITLQSVRALAWCEVRAGMAPKKNLTFLLTLPLRHTLYLLQQGINPNDGQLFCKKAL